MRLTFIETSGFTQAVRAYFPDDAAYAAFQEALLQNSARGDVMPGCGGLRKVRWPDPRRGKGKRGGLRLIYLHVPEAETVVLLDVYDKDETDDLTQDQRRQLAQLAHAIREELLRPQRSGGRRPT
ncbi:MAG: toxin [Armatimonadetes bacterium]|nr:toxin [Armatimonadota bacterium]